MSIYYNKSIALLFAAGILASCSRNNHEEEVKRDAPVTVTLSLPSTPSVNSIHVSGQIQSKKSAAISTRVMGFITNINVKPGDKVQSGQLLVTISNADILAKRAQAQALLTEAEAALKDAKRDYERFTELYQQNSASTKELENVALHYNSTKAKTEAARQMQHEAEAMLSYTNLTAPFAGVITQKNSDVGSMANPGVPILTIEQTGSYQVNASVSEADIVHIKEGTEAHIVIKSSGRIVRGYISEVSPSSQFTGGQYNIKVAIPEEETFQLYSGMYVSVSIQGTGVKPASNSVFVPLSAIINNDQLSGLYTISQNQTAILRWVRLGETQGNMVEVLSGLNHSEKFILESSGKLYNGASVLVK